MALFKGAGALSERVKFQKQIVSVDEVGNRINTWSDYISCWASVKSASGEKAGEKEDAAQTLEQDRLDFTVRYSSQTSEIRSSEYRIIFKERIYNIDHVDIGESKKQALKFSGYLVRR